METTAGRREGGDMELGYRLMVGLDWATQAHQVCVLDRQGRLLEQRRVEHRAEAIAAMIDRLSGWPAVTRPRSLSPLRYLAGLWSKPWSSEAFMSSRSIQSNSTASAIATRWPERRMTGGTPSCWPIRSGRIFPPSPFGRCLDHPDPGTDPHRRKSQHGDHPVGQPAAGSLAAVLSAAAAPVPVC